MKRYANLVEWLIIALALYTLVALIVLLYGICTGNEASQLIFLVILATAAFGTNDKPRRINNRLKSPYYGN